MRAHSRAMGSMVAGLALAVAAMGVMPAWAADGLITSTGQNLPALGGAAPYQAGPGPAAEIRAYHTSGQWSADRARIADEASGFLDAWLASCRQQSACRPAAVFDIDETLLSSYATFTRADFAPTANQRAQAQARCQQSAIASVVRLFRQVRDEGVAIVIITGRSDRARAATVSCLGRKGVTGWDRLIMRSASQRSVTAAAYKAAARAGLEDEGFDIAFSIGDQFSDVAGGHFAHGYVLPNPMSYIP